MIAPATIVQNRRQWRWTLVPGQKCPLWVISGICSAKRRVRFTPNSDRESASRKSHLRFTPTRTSAVQQGSLGLGTVAEETRFSQLIALLAHRLKFNVCRPIHVWIDLGCLQPHLFASVAPS